MSDARSLDVSDTRIGSASKLMEGSEAIAQAAIAAGCRFFAGYPMTPFTELLEHFAKRLPETEGEKTGVSRCVLVLTQLKESPHDHRH